MSLKRMNGFGKSEPHVLALTWVVPSILPPSGRLFRQTNYSGDYPLFSLNSRPTITLVVGHSRHRQGDRSRFAA